MTNCAAWSGSIKREERPALTLDGMLGPVFSRIYINAGSVKDDVEEKTVSVHHYHEYLLLAMSRQDMRKRMGHDNEPVVHEQMEQWGYKHGNNWDRVDFDMLFDRLCLRLSVERLEENYRYSGPTVKRRTGNLAALLGIPLDRARYKRRGGF